MNHKKLKVLTFNVRGYNTAERKRKTNLLLDNEGVDIAVLTETWLNNHQNLGTETFEYIKSPPSSHQGVAIAFRRSQFDLVQILHQDLHTQHTIVVKLRTSMFEVDQIPSAPTLENP